MKRDGIELTGSSVITIPADMKVGAIEETVVVTGESPVVDVQTARREIVLQNSVIQTLPVARAVGALLNATPGLQVDNNGPALSPTMTFFNANSSTINSTSVAGEGRMTVNGFTVAAARSGGVSSYVYDTPNAEEVGVVVGGGLGESDIGGPVMNLVPRSGSNRFAGNTFLNLAGEWSRGDNLTDELTALNPNLTQTPGIIHAHDFSGSFGGPILKDRLWFYGSYRALSTQTAMEGITANANAGDATRWDWRRLADRRAPRAGPPDDHRSFHGADSAGTASGSTPSTSIAARARRSRSKPKAVITAAQDWIGLGNNLAPFQSPEATSTAARGYFDVPVLPQSGVLDDAGEQQAAARCRLHAVPLQPDLRPSVAGRHHQPDSRDGAVERDQPGDRPAVCAAGDLHLPGYSELGMGGRQDRRLAGDGVVRDRRAQHEGRLPGQPAGPARSNDREPDAARLPLQPGRAERGQLLAARLRPSHDHEPARLLRPGQLDARPPHDAGRAAVRPGVELCADRTERHDEDVVPESGGHHHSADAWRQRVPRHHAARRRRLRRVRHGQNGASSSTGATTSPMPRTIRRTRRPTPALRLCATSRTASGPTWTTTRSSTATC